MTCRSGWKYCARTFEPGYEKKRLVWKASATTSEKLSVRLEQRVFELGRRLLVPDPQILWLPAAGWALARRLLSTRVDVVFISGPPFSQFPHVAVLSISSASTVACRPWSSELCFGRPLPLHAHDEQALNASRTADTASSSNFCSAATWAWFLLESNVPGTESRTMSMSSSPVQAQGFPIAPREQVEIPLSVRIVKRCFDLTLSLLGLFVAAVLSPVLALAIYLDSPGPILYHQRRASALRGKNAKGRCVFGEFDMLKFRTMRANAENHTGAVLAEENDPRVTRVGRFLRRTRLDELPQLWNVLKGDMTVIGPRPERPELLQNLALAIPFFEERMHDTRPGITGLAQVSLSYSGRAPSGSAVARISGSLTNPFRFAKAEGSLADDMRTKLLFDLAYVAALERFATFIVMDLWIIVRTPWVMLQGLGR
jgi:lipopolysaccharide/colanic/teichoic acid biosynthesis glycosyltransferase